jgi:hypothetical protein
LPLYESDPETPSRAIPADFMEAPILKKPKKKATAEEWKAYEKEAKKHRIPVKFIEAIKKFRQSLDEQDLKTKY